MTIATEAAALKQQLQSDLATAHRFYDPDMHPEALRAKRVELAKAVRDKHAPTVASLRTRMAREVQSAGERAARVRPTADGETLARKWSQVKDRLDAQIPFQRIIAKADAATLAAIAEYGPSWLEAQHEMGQPSGLVRNDGNLATALARLGNEIDGRLLEVGSADTVAAIQADREARTTAAEFEQHARYLDGVVAGRGGDLLGSAVAAALAGQAATAGFDSDAVGTMTASAGGAAAE